MINKKGIFNKLGMLLLVLMFIPIFANAASLGISPSTISRTVGSTFSTVIYLSSSDKAANAASGIVTFPKDKLEVVSISKSNSVINLWVQEPTFSNSQGDIHFEGIVLNPGYTGNNGTVLTVTFRTKSAGTANIKFLSGSVLANDGSGTNILVGLGSANASIKEVPPPQDVIEEKPKAKVKIEVPETPKKEEVTEVEDVTVFLPEVPVITYYQEEIESGGLIKIQGIADPGVDVKIKIIKSGEPVQQKIVRSTGSGNFLIAMDPVSQPGVYTFIAQAVDEAGNSSNETSPFTVIVNQKWFDGFLESILKYLTLTVVLGMSLVGVTMVGMFLWYRLRTVMKRIRQRGKGAEKVLEKSFGNLKKDINEHLAKLRTAKDKRKLSDEESEFLEKFEKKLAEIKSQITKEVEDISR